MSSSIAAEKVTQAKSHGTFDCSIVFGVGQEKDDIRLLGVTGNIGILYCSKMETMVQWYNSTMLQYYGR